MENRSSIVGSFISGAMSSAFSGVLMAGIVAAIGPLLGAGAIGWGGAMLMVSATSIFGGVMGVKRTLFDAPSSARNQATVIPVPVTGLSGPAVTVPGVSADQSLESAQPSRNWVASTGREADTQSRIQQIIAQGSMSDKDRASAILAAREAAATAETARG